MNHSCENTSLQNVSVENLQFSKPSRTDLYLDARLLIMRTDAQD